MKTRLHAAVLMETRIIHAATVLRRIRVALAGEIRLLAGWTAKWKPSATLLEDIVKSPSVIAFSSECFLCAL